MKGLRKKKVILIDGNSLVYRAFYALPTTLATKAGQITNAVYGFTGMLIRLLREQKPDVVVVAFDKGMPLRVNQYEEYKAHRPETPDELKSQFPLVKDVLCALNIPIFEVEGFEADDVLATLAKEAESEGYEAVVVTGDRDAFQLISPSVKIMTTRKGISDIVLYDRRKVVERYGIPPEKMPDMLGLKGDASDNIPGVPGIGEKTASKLIQEFGSLEGVLDHVDELPNRLRETLIEHKEQARLSKQLATLDFDVPTEVDLKKYRWGKWDETRVRELFSCLEFNTLLERLLGEEFSEKDTELVSLDIRPGVILSLRDLENLLKKLNQSLEMALEVCSSGVSVDQHLEGLAIALETGGSVRVYYIPLADEGGVIQDKLFASEGELSRSLILSRLKGYLESLRLSKLVHDGKMGILCFKKEGLDLRGISFDTMIAAYLLDPGRGDYPLENLCREYLRAKISGDGTQNTCQRALATLKLQSILKAELERRGLLKLFKEIEVPLIPVLARMEWEGVGIDAEVLEVLSSEVDDVLRTLEKEIYNLAGEEFNINSPQQLGKVLFEKLRLEVGKRTKTGYSTDFSVLIKLVDEHPIIERILRYRELSKLKSTYIDALPKLINPQTARVHTSFNQTGTATGRLSSSNPNLQNIPIRTELGRRIREAFVPSRSTDEFLMADYSQIELRILAHLSQDENLLRAFREDRDIHQATACEVFGVEPKDVDPGMRRAAKAVNFGIVYGISSYGLSEQLGISKEDAKLYIDKYFKRYPDVRKFVDKVVAGAYRDGFVATIFGRRRYIPELKSSNYRIRNLGERLAINACIQGSAADIIKVAMIALDRELGKRRLETKMILQVHDELLFEVPSSGKKVSTILIREVMEGAYPLKAGLKVDITSGPRWGKTL
ncbi:MAG: DNA polymerase I [Actinomycetota bacterium]|nr:DNA polymerase I [Actinomycetota bacterium]